jgi:ankyrin repeat protein
LPTRTLREHPDLDQLRRQAKELLKAFLAGEQSAAAEVRAHYHDADPATFALHDAQLVLARAYGFDSWPKLKAYVDGVTVKRFDAAARSDDLAQIQAMLRVRPELARKGGAILYAVLNRSLAMVRVLMEHGAGAREGVYPHRDATSPLAIAMERGYDEIVAAVREAEQRRRDAQSGCASTPSPDEVMRTIAAGDTERAIGMLEADPALVHSRHSEFGITPLHVAARALDLRIVDWLLDHGAHPSERSRNGSTPLDWAAHSGEAESGAQFRTVADALLGRGAEQTARAAVALGDAEWLRARHTEGTLENPIEDTGGLLRIAVSFDRPEILALLLDFGFDPDERTRYEGVGVDGIEYTQGMPLCHCAESSKYEMAEMLLKHGADPNASAYASGDPVFRAYSKRDWEMAALLARYGGVPCASTAGLYRQTELSRKMLAGEARYRQGRSDGVAGELLWGAACGGDPELVRLALERIDWPRDDPRWFEMLEQPLRVWDHGGNNGDRSTYAVCFRLVLERCDPNLRGRMEDRGFGLTILHSVAGSRAHVTAEERLTFATMLLDAGARLDLRDNLLRSTPLGWACRWGRVELVELFLERGADAVEADAEPWATPEAWARKGSHAEVLRLLGRRGG